MRSSKIAYNSRLSSIMRGMTNKVLITVLVLVVIALIYPAEQTVAPEWKVSVVDDKGARLAGIHVREIWRQYSIEDKDHEEVLTTDASGSAVFPKRTLKSGYMQRMFGCWKKRRMNPAEALCSPASIRVGLRPWSRYPARRGHERQPSPVLQERTAARHRGRAADIVVSLASLSARTGGPWMQAIRRICRGAVGKSSISYFVFRIQYFVLRQECFVLKTSHYMATNEILNTKYCLTSLAGNPQ